MKGRNKFEKDPNHKIIFLNYFRVLHSVNLKEEKGLKEIKDQVFHCNLCDKSFKTKYKFTQEYFHSALFITK